MGNSITNSRISSPSDVYGSGDTVSTYMEGVSDDIIHAVVLLLVILVPIVVYLVRSGGRYHAQVIHPQYVELVNEARDRINTALHSGSASDTATTQEEEARGSEAGSSRPTPTAPPPTPPSEPSDDDTAAVHTRNRYYDESQMQCPICYAEPARYAVETNCGHLYCARCIIMYWNRGSNVGSSWLTPIACPVCRRQVTVFLPQLREAVLTDSEVEDRNQLLAQINTYNRRFSGLPRHWLDYLRDAPVFLRHLYTNFFTISGLQWVYRLRILAMLLLAVLYVLSPLDLVPEAVFGALGLIDDALVIAIFAIYISIVYRYFLANNDDW